jgi:hypothetical protein
MAQTTNWKPKPMQTIKEYLFGIDESSLNFVQNLEE